MRSNAGLAVSMIAGGALAMSVSGCSFARAWSALFRTSSEPVPVPSLASSSASAEAFDAIRETWRRPDRAPPQALRGQLEAFLARWPDDGLAPLARVYLALVALGQGDLLVADRELAATAQLPPGNTRDLRTVASARRLRLGGSPDVALDLLRPLVGKNVDPLTGSVFEQELTLSALAAHRDYEAISYMDAWLRASDEGSDEASNAVTGLVEKLPQEVVVGALQAMRSQRASFGYGVAIERILARRLVQIATASGDAQLARLLLESDAGALLVGGEAGAALGELATSRRGMNVVEGRSLGLLLPTESPALRDESADVLRGVMWALGLPRGVRASPAHATPDAGGAALTVHPPCAPGEPAPPPGEPEEGVRLVTRNDAGSVDRTEGALDELAGAGAAVIVAGLDPLTAGRALRWAEVHHVSVVAVVPPDELPPTTDYSFVLGAGRAEVVAALARAVPALTAGPIAPVADASELPSFPAGGGRVGPLTLLQVVSCDIPAARAGDPRFPLSLWEHDRAAGWLVSGSPACAADLARELSTAHPRGLLALTLEAASLPAHAAGLGITSASAGVVPQGLPGDARDDELRRFAERLGGVGWWTALGRDAATLGRLSIRALPPDTTSDAAAVAERRGLARDRLASSRAPLWSTEASGWTRGRVMERSICGVAAPPR